MKRILRINRNNIISCMFCISLCFCTSSFALTFKEADFERLILNHPMMKNYDNKTGHFKNSSYVLHDVNELEKEVEALSAKLEVLKNKETEMASHSAAIVEDTEEEKFWGNISVESEQIKELEEKIWEKKNLIISGGDTGYDNLFNILSKMSDDVILPLYDESRIVVNKLPKYYFPNISDRKGINKLFNINNSESLKEYIKKASVFGLIFPESDKSILYNKEEVDINKIGIIDLNLVLMLHPKMSLYNFRNSGFNKYELGLTKEEIIKKEELLNNTHHEAVELNNLKRELEELYSQKIAYYDNLNSSGSNEKIAEFFKNFPEKEKELRKKIFDNEYKIDNPSVTSPEESIKIIEEVYDDINQAIKEVIKEKEILLLLNSNLPIDFGYEVKYSLGKIKGLGYAGINYILFYGFFNNNYLKGPFKILGEDIFHRRRFKLIRDEAEIKKYVLPLKPYPMVICGGNSILSDVIQKLYSKYKIDSSAYKVLCSVISKIEVYQNDSKK